MNTTDTPDEQEIIRQAMSIIGRARTEKKIAAARATAASRRGSTWTEDQKEKQKEAQAARREREKQERIALGLAETDPTEKKRPGRPRTRPIEEGPKRPRGRPKKNESSA